MMKSFVYSNLPISISPVRLNFRLKFLWILLSSVVFSLLAVCVFQLNAYTSQVYLISDYEKKLNYLNQENKMLEINFSKANSLVNIGNYVQNFEKANKIEYVRVLESTALAK
ncbi:MAG: hypothetical protein PHE52_00560 [Candidatus Pacebacteria bacterium]|nr:hypothetical protein [Candidatus Paceibacterota bacterium]